VTHYLLVVRGPNGPRAIATYDSRLRAVAEAWRQGFTSYDVQPVLVVDLRGGF
jgi:hypothetical protein